MSGRFTDRAATDVGADGRPVDWGHHGGHGFRGGEPVAVVVTGGNRAAIVQVTEHERHCAEPLKTAAWVTCDKTTEK